MMSSKHFVVFFYFVLPYVIGAVLLPNNDTLYKYMGEVKIGVDEQTPYVSSFEIYGNLQVRAYTEDSNMNNAYLLHLSNIEYSIYNGPDCFGKESRKRFIVSDKISLLLQEPFLAIYNEINMLEGLKFQNIESAWSKNIKKAIAASLQFDISTIDLNDSFRHSAFLTDEHTVHGLCSVSYNVHTLNYQEFSESNGIVIKKFYDPKTCTKFIQKAFSHSENFRCYVEREEDLIVSTRKEMYLEKSASSLFLNKLSSFESLYYFPFMHMSEIHRIELRQTLEFVKHPIKTIAFPKVDFQSISMTTEFTFEKQIDIVNFMEDITYDRHKVNSSSLILKINKIIFEVAEYIEEHSLLIADLNVKHEQLFNRLIISMTSLDIDSMKELYDGIRNPKTTREEIARKIFLEMLPHIGTTSSCSFILNIFTHQKYDVSDNDLISILTKFPSYVRHPTEKLLFQMEEFFQMNNSSKYFKSKQVKKSAILKIANPPLLEKYIQYIGVYLQDTTNSNYEMKLVHLMALRNIQVGNIERILIPIISGELVIHKSRQEQIRLAATFAVTQAINHDKELVNNLFWPILSDSMNSLQLRIMAYDMLISQLPDTQRAMNIHWFMVNEQNRHLYNYHYTTMKSLAHLKEPCLRPVMELARKIWRLTKNRNIFGPISGSYIVDYLDSKYGYGETYKLAMNIDDQSGLPRMGFFEYYQSIGRRSSPVWGIYWNTNILGSILNIWKQIMINNKVIIIDESVKEILRKTKGYDSTMSETGYVDMFALSRGRVVQVSSIYNAHLHGETMLSAIRTLVQHHSDFDKKKVEINWQSLSYMHLIKMIVSSDMGLPITFSNQQPLLLSTRTKIEFATSNSIFSLKINSDNRIWLQTSYQIEAYNPIADIFHSVQRASTIDVVFPIELELLYDLDGHNLKLKFLRSPNTKTRKIRKHVGSLVTIFGDENNLLKDHCPACLHYKFINSDSKYLMNHQETFDLQNVGLKYLQSLVDCDSDNLILLNEEWFKILKNVDTETGNDPIYALFLLVSHEIVNNMMSPIPGTCKNMIYVVEDVDNISYVEIGLAWATKFKQMDSNFNHISSISEDFYFYSFVNTISSSNLSSVNFWGFNVTLHNNNNNNNNNNNYTNDMEVHFIQRMPGRKNVVGCIQSYKFNLSRNSRISWKITFNVDISELDKCGTGRHFINGTMTTSIIKDCNNMKQDVNHKCLEDKNNFIPFGNTSESTYFFKNNLFKTLDNQHLREIVYDVNLTFSKISQEMMSILYYSKVKNLKSNVEVGHLRINLILSSKGSNIYVFTPLLSYEVHTFPLDFIALKSQSNDVHLLFTKICTIFSDTIILNNNEKESTKLTDWALISGDFVHFSFVILAKVAKENKIAVKVYHGSHVLEIQPTESAFKFIFNHIEIRNSKNKKYLPSGSRTLDDSIISIESTNAYLEVKLIYISVNVQYSNNHLTVMVKNSMQDHIDGLCADSGYTKITKVANESK